MACDAEAIHQRFVCLSATLVPLEERVQALECFHALSRALGASAALQQRVEVLERLCEGTVTGEREREPTGVPLTP